ncbi:hypothetical protein MTO96_026094 [Rhipicephalus appendiculatus]
MLVVLGLGSWSVYEEDFEKPFLVESAKFYALRGQHYIGTRDSLEYVAQVEQHINEESERVKQCLDESTVIPLVQVIERELIWKHMKAIVDMEDSGVEHMLKNQMTDDLARLVPVPQARSGWRENVARLRQQTPAQSREICRERARGLGEPQYQE